jgi:hypothetical protein
MNSPNQAMPSFAKATAGRLANRFTAYGFTFDDIYEVLWRVDHFDESEWTSLRSFLPSRCWTPPISLADGLETAAP